MKGKGKGPVATAQQTRVVRLRHRRVSVLLPSSLPALLGYSYLRIAECSVQIAG
jgi:hypothetical protein